ncbi:penicillin-binding protein activator LpoB [Erwinia sp. CPCC 100877]|nr:penicillin-binding protein activator LpoB [Erwinia sp. CPCC 100877]
MIKGIHRYLIVISTALVLAGCGIRSTEQPAPIEEAKPTPEQPVPQPQVPKIPEIPEQPGPVTQPETPPPAPERTWNWEQAAQPMVAKMLQADGLTPGSVLLVDSVNNRTNGSLPTAKATEALRNTLANNGKFTLVGAQQLAMAKQQLGLSPQDSLGSRSKAIGIARNVGAQYVLYTSAAGNVNTPTLAMQLMLVQTGEIIWSGKGSVERTQ